MPTPPLSRQEAHRTLEAVERAKRDIGFSGKPSQTYGERGYMDRAAAELGIAVGTLFGRIRPGGAVDRAIGEQAPPNEKETARHSEAETYTPLKDFLRGSGRTVHAIADHFLVSSAAVEAALDELAREGVRVIRERDTVRIATEVQPAAYVAGPTVEIISRPDNTFMLGACGDLHAGSKYTRWDVRNDLFRRYRAANVQAVIDTGNWIDGDAAFNRHDVEVQGLARQVKMLAERHPKVQCPIYAVTGDDHEGWYEQREGIDVGWYCEQQMQKAGHDWRNLGYMEAHIRLVNANTGASSILAVVHPGGGSAYALSYTVQKWVESLEGGEKPAVAFLGHYHKIISGLDRNVWWLQTGTSQDQTPFMRKKKLAAHVGGALVGMEQDPETGAIISFTPQLIRYFNKAYYDTANRWSKHGGVEHAPRQAGSGA